MKDVSGAVFNVVTEDANTLLAAKHGLVREVEVVELDVPEDFCVELTAARQREGISQRALGRRMMMDETIVSRLERGQEPSLSTLRTWAEALKYRVAIITDIAEAP